MAEQRQQVSLWNALGAIVPFTAGSIWTTDEKRDAMQSGGILTNPFNAGNLRAAFFRIPGLDYTIWKPFSDADETMYRIHLENNAILARTGGRPATLEDIGAARREADEALTRYWDFAGTPGGKSDLQNDIENAIPDLPGGDIPWKLILMVAAVLGLAFVATKVGE